MAIDFDPNQPTKTKNFLWATYIVNRNPQFKLHTGRGHALSACTNHGGEFALYRWDEINSRWEELVRNEKPFDKRACYSCGYEAQSNWDWYPKRKWTNLNQPIPTLAWVCSRCS